MVDVAIESDEKFLQIITGLCAAAEYSDELTGKHILRVNEYAKLLARSLDRAPNFIERIGKVAALHDIGKVAIPNIIKLKRTLDPLELSEMRMHTIYGAQIINKMISFDVRSWMFSIRCSLIWFLASFEGGFIRPPAMQMDGD